MNRAPTANEMTQRRVQTVRLAQQKYWDVSDSADSAVTDMLCDIRHFCDAEGLDFGKLDKTAHRHYVLEAGQ